MTPPTNPPARNRSAKLPLVLMLWPVVSCALLVVVFIISIIVQPPMHGDNELFANPSLGRRIFEISFFITMGLTFIAGPISFLAGIILLIMRKS